MRHLLVLGMLLALVDSYSYGQIRFGGGPHFGLAFASFKGEASDAYGTGLLFGAHGDLALSRHLTLRVGFDYTTFGADEGKLRTGVTNTLIQEITQRLGPLSNADIQFITNAVGSVTGARINLPTISLSGLAKFPVGSSFAPYGLIGFGMVFARAGDVTIQSPTGLTGGGAQFLPAGASTVAGPKETRFGLQFGAGTEYKVSRMVGLFFEVRYNLFFSSGDNFSYLPLMIGATFGG